MLIYELKNGMKLSIRKATEGDAGELTNIEAQIGGESDNLTFGRDDFYLTEEQEREFIRNTSNRENCIFIVGLIDGRIIGSLTFIASPRKRMMHRGELGIAVLKQFWGIGVGNFLMDYLFRWVNSNGIINKVDLSVREDNINAINLYMKWGFKIEGRISKGLYINGKYYDLYNMGKIIG